MAKKIEKEKKEAWKVLKQKCVVQKPARVPGDSSFDDSDEVVLDDSTLSEGDESDSYTEGMVDRCAECGKKFISLERHHAIGCDTEYCHHWYHPQCTDFDYKGKTANIVR